MNVNLSRIEAALIELTSNWHPTLHHSDEIKCRNLFKERTPDTIFHFVSLCSYPVLIAIHNSTITKVLKMANMDVSVKSKTDKEF